MKLIIIIWCVELNIPSLSCNSLLLTLLYAGGMLKGFCIQILSHHMNIFLFGMKILGWKTSMETSSSLAPVYSAHICHYMQLLVLLTEFCLPDILTWSKNMAWRYLNLVLSPITDWYGR